MKKILILLGCVYIASSQPKITFTKCGKTTNLLGVALKNDAASKLTGGVNFYKALDKGVNDVDEEFLYAMNHCTRYGSATEMKYLYPTCDGSTLNVKRYSGSQAHLCGSGATIDSDIRYNCSTTSTMCNCDGADRYVTVSANFFGSGMYTASDNCTATTHSQSNLNRYTYKFAVGVCQPNTAGTKYYKNFGAKDGTKFYYQKQVFTDAACTTLFKIKFFAVETCEMVNITAPIPGVGFVRVTGATDDLACADIPGTGTDDGYVLSTTIALLFAAFVSIVMY